MKAIGKNDIKKKKSITIFEKVLRDKLILNECIRNGGDFTKVAKENNVKLATPV